MDCRLQSWMHKLWTFDSNRNLFPDFGFANPVPPLHVFIDSPTVRVIFDNLKSMAKRAICFSHIIHPAISLPAPCVCSTATSQNGKSVTLVS